MEQATPTHIQQRREADYYDFVRFEQFQAERAARIAGVKEDLFHAAETLLTTPLALGIEQRAGVVTREDIGRSVEAQPEKLAVAAKTEHLDYLSRGAYGEVTVRAALRHQNTLYSNN